MPTYAAYSTETGEITKILSMQEADALLNVSSAESMLEISGGVADDTHYILNGEAVEKIAIVATVSVAGDEVVVTGIPAGLEVSFDGVTAITDDDPLELTVDEPDTYVLRIYGGAQYLDTEMVIDLG